MVNVTHQKGAMTVIGWTGNISDTRTNTWLEAFFVSCGKGKRIGNVNIENSAIYAANFKTSEDYNGIMGGLDQVYIKGSTTQKLTS